VKKKEPASPRRGAAPSRERDEGDQTTLPFEMKMGRHAVGIVDDHPMTRSGIEQLINQQVDVFVAFEAASPQEALAAIPKHGPDLLLADMTMEGRSGLEFIKDVRSLYPNLLILVLSMHDELVYAERVLRCGAQGFVMKDQGGEVLLAAIRRVLAGEIYVSPAMATRLLRTISGAPLPSSGMATSSLTDREIQVFEMLGQGKNIDQIARQLRISPKTADVHRSRIREKLGMPNLTALMRYAVRWVEAKGE
jgi:DNA-binding NarL/FixJ family response regulator